MKSKKKTSVGPLLLRLALILLCMVAFTTSMLSGLYARYTSKNNGDDSARVATFKVEADWSGDVTVDASQDVTSGTYTFTVDNGSEVAVTYDLIITFDGSIPDYLNVSLAGYTGVISGNTVTFYKVANLASDSTDIARTLTFTMDPAKFTQNVTTESHQETVAFTATIRCTQID